MNPTATVAAELLPLERINHWARVRGNQIYLSQPVGGGEMRHYTWAEVADQARRMAAHLQSKGWPAGSRIAILSKNCAHWLICDYAIWMAGHVSVPLYPTLTADSIRQILEHSESVACFVGKLDGWEAMRPGIPAGIHCIALPLAPKTDYEKWDDLTARHAPLQGALTRPGSDLCTIVYTSGTTGMPKGVMHNFNSIAWAAASLHERFGGTPEDRMLSYLPLSHVAERWVVEAGSLNTGFRIFFAESLETFADDLRRARPTQFISVPRLWVKFQQGVFAKIPRKKLDRLFKIPLLGRLVKKKILKGMGLDQARFAGGGAAPMPPSVLDWFAELGLTLLEGYGMTENFGCSHSNQMGRQRVGYVGEVYPGIEHRIDPQTGEVQMRSPALMLGYYKEPAKTAETMTADGWLRTGDKGEIDSEGRLRITGRVKDLFKTSKGKYVAPAPIEDKLVGHSAVEACCVAGANFAQPFGILMLSQDAATKTADAAYKAEIESSLREHLHAVNAQLDAHEQMDFIAVVREQWTVENGFLTPTLKIKRNRIEDVYGPRFEAWQTQRQPVVWVD